MLFRRTSGLSPVSTGLAFAAVSLLLLVVSAGAAGCSQKRLYKHPAFVTEGDVAKYLRTALENPQPDERREAIQRIAQTRYAGHQTVIDGLDIIARTDVSPAVRCAALLALRRTPGAVPTFLAILDPDAPPESVRPAPPDVRRDALRGLLTVLPGGAVPSEHEPAIQETAVRVITTDASRDNRQAAAAILGYCPDRSVLGPLIAALEQRDFGVVHEAERSLMRLTGRTFQHDAVQWRRWLAETDGPFADAGRLDQELDRARKGWWQRSMDSLGHSARSFRPKGGYAGTTGSVPRPGDAAVGPPRAAQPGPAMEQDGAPVDSATVEKGDS